MSQVKPTIAAIAWFYPFNQTGVFMGTAMPIAHTADALLCLLQLASPALPVGADLLVINKTDLAPLVGTDLSAMERDANKMRGDKQTRLFGVNDNNPQVRPSPSHNQ